MNGRKKQSFGMFVIIAAFILISHGVALAAPGAGRLLGTNANGGVLLDINPGTGSAVPIGFMGVGVTPSLATDPLTGLVYVATGGGNPVLFTVNPANGMTTLVGNTGLGFSSVGGMDFDAAGNLYAAVNIAGDGGTGSDHLATLNTNNGQATIIGPFGACQGVPPIPVNGAGFCTIEGIEGIAFDASGILWGVHTARGAAGPAGLYTINPGSGAAAFVSPILDAGGNPPSGGLSSIQFACDGTLFGGTARGTFVNDGGFLVTVNPLTGQFAFVGAFSATGGSSLGGLTFELPCLDPTSIEVSKTADLESGMLTGTISITNVGENPAVILGIEDTLEVHFPKVGKSAPPALPEGSTPNWFEVADVPVANPGIIEVAETVEVDYSFDLCLADDFTGANSMRNVVAVTLANKPEKARTDTVVTRSESFEPLVECLFLVEDFESGSLGNEWTTSSSTPQGRIQVTGAFGTAAGSFALLMDTTVSGPFNNNEGVWTVDLSGFAHATMEFFHADFNDEETSLPGSFGGSVIGDGVSISDDGVNWHTVLNATAVASGQWDLVQIDLSAEAASAGMTLGPNFKIKFQQFDNFPLTTDGRGYDEITIFGPAL